MRAVLLAMLVVGASAPVVQAEALPDLVVLDLAAHPANPAPGETVVFTATVRNLGPGTAGASVLMICITEEGFLSEVKVPPLAPGQQLTLTSDPWTAVGQVQLAQAFADWGSDLEEVSETNNAAELLFWLARGPDLRVSLVRMAPPQPVHGSQVRYEATVRNDGGAPSGAGLVTFRLDGQVVSEGFLPGLEVGASAVVASASHTARAGAHVARAEADEADAIPEEDEGNNGAELAFQVARPPPLALEPVGDAQGSVAVSGTGDATGTLAVSAAGDSEGVVAVSLLGRAQGDVAVSGCDALGACAG